MPYRVTVADSFAKGLKSLPPHRIKAAGRSLRLFAETPQLNRLNFRPLRGVPGYYLINGQGGDRIILRKESEDLFTAVDVGPHDNILRKWNR